MPLWLESCGPPSAHLDGWCEAGLPWIWPSWVGACAAACNGSAGMGSLRQPPAKAGWGEG